MFVIQKDKKIILTKGDTATIAVAVVDLDNCEYKIKDTDVIKMSVRKSANTISLLDITATADHFLIINHADTANMAPGLYVYDIQLTTVDGYVYTIVPQSFFQLTSEVTV